MTILDLIEQKKTGKELSKEAWDYFITGVMSGAIADYQISAFLMAICLRGMSETETAYLTEFMAKSGDRLTLPKDLYPVADKHSTGGIGDKTTLIVAPILAACGITVAKMSGRGLGYTGGTVDKLESIPGFCTTLSEENFLASLSSLHIALIGQSKNLAPADKKLYALRDVTGTVNSIPLIAASIMSKKLAAGADVILLDVKMGSGAFMKDRESARELASIMVRIVQHHQKKIKAMITDMNIPLGNAVGNALEVREAMAILQGKQQGRLLSLCLALAAELIAMAKSINTNEALSLAEKQIESGKAYDVFCAMVKNQGGDLLKFSKVTAAFQKEFTAKQDGYIFQMDSEKVGKASLILGAGRLKKEDPIDPAAGILFHKHYGDYVRRGEVIATLYTEREKSLIEAGLTLSRAISLSEAMPPNLPIVYEIL